LTKKKFNLSLLLAPSAILGRIKTLKAFQHGKDIGESDGLRLKKNPKVQVGAWIYGSKLSSKNLKKAAL